MKQRVIVDPKIMLGKPVIAGTRITVEQILRLLSQGQKEEEIIENFPYLTKADIKAAIAYAHQLVAEEEVYKFDEKNFQKETKVSSRRKLGA